ncbi:hypothetical protein A3A84_04000 [Candidatus Collierbacteria bacterium RIFCSPLOWO2_01_FULL_50_23]|uniref:Uncharacterized protein n=2 Tax=Candidatus Collieribacteriota TaxID=1752725 RepID=A0A1F5ERC4_9BACT|nr:MAG: hypothetical protein A3D09_03025 [Candidatus Collierbacteria bacterium RIFCSPHIGHO2_02_FULL_49_10]OGD71727.1 MAG: hypothetical protein A2703_03290 [Candidatus Collierbacteria bacterium RIFCSPHIGHO2_01_FULL_50_25]OGD74582.1 MAG: hypothetical protein A3A84_04000 [Candidatus Collierbacteria bacterium RIFCSPLOWO2_01_FULL_50_23]
MGEVKGALGLTVVPLEERVKKADDPLAWLGNHKEEIEAKVNKGYRFFQAEIVLPDGRTSKIAFCGDDKHRDDAVDHAIYIELPAILDGFSGLKYDEDGEVWTIGEKSTKMFLREHGGVYTLKEIGDLDIRSDVASMTLEAIISSQRDGGAKIAWLSPVAIPMNGLVDLFGAEAEYRKSKQSNV